MNVMLALIGTTIALATLPVTWMNWRRGRSERATEQFTRIRSEVRTQQRRLHSIARQTTKKAWQSYELPVLTKPDWIFEQPAPLSAVRLHWHDRSDISDNLDAARRRARKMLPIRSGGTRYDTYCDTLAALGEMGGMFNGWIYRPIGINATSDQIDIHCTDGRYFEHLDTTEILAHEAAKRLLAGHPLDGAYRSYLGDPFDLTRRGTSLGIITLTIRVSDNDSGFYMHHRNTSNLIVGPDIIHVVPAGEFTPADIGLESRLADFDIWHTVMREYVEEFLDVEEAYGAGGRPIDYKHDEPFGKLVAARKTGGLRLYVLGISLDPLTWKPELLLVCIIDALTFDDLFADIVQIGREGTIVVGPKGHGIPFNKATVERYANDPSTRSAAQACLRLVWQHRISLGIGN